MLEWITNNAGTIIISLVVAAVLIFAVYSIVKDKKKGSCSCGGSCGSCPMGGSCHNNNKDIKK